MVVVGKARSLGPFEEAEGLGRGFDAAEGLEEGGLGERGEGREAGFDSGRPGIGVNEPGHGLGFLAFDRICIWRRGLGFILGGGGGRRRLAKQMLQSGRERRGRIRNPEFAKLSCNT